MHTPEDMTPAERELELALRSLRPDGAATNEVDLAFRLGEATGARRLRRWQASTACGAAAAVLSIVAAVAWRMETTPAAATHETMMADAVESMPEEPTREEDVPFRAPFAMRGLYMTSAYMRQRERSIRRSMDDVDATAPTSEVGLAAAEVRTERPVAERQSDFDLFIQAFNAKGQL